ncbi:methyl-accepting chemotaxis protein [Desulfuribacillus alkaliarsenatis]|uniref:Chemotaxis protein n=1 Tax=Desulfuribacillus alkaliarsenatis TaxID=766136 RepID=A0A1E5G0Z7_9FIRM|nr:methyl-accepting chemotaxis protein [Desulfuribacillus alkaliarsenatis]OEF96585.1 hypothetical protein BHF68_08030 [Desulfuribacillus alkaliarsenatis]
MSGRFKLNIGTKLLGAFIVIFIMIIAMGGAVYYFMEMQQQAQINALETMEDFIFFVEREVDHLNWVNGLANMFVTGEEFTGQLDHRKCALGEWYYAVVETEAFQLLPADFRRTFVQLEEPHRYLHNTAIEILDVIEADAENGISRAIEIYETETRQHMAEVRRVITELNSLLEIQTSDNLALADQQASRTIQVLIYVTIAVIVFGVVIAIFLTKAITNPIKNVVDSLREMAESGGDLTRRIEVKSKDEVGDLAYWFNAFVGKLQGIIKNVRTSTDIVNNGSMEIASGNQDLSQRTEEQASALEEVASTIEEINSSMEASSSNAVEADNLSKRTLETVRNGEQVVNNLQESMTEITKGSREISEIISTVNDIAFQTNLLALNAAVEAARAGEQGRGFAVVAAEVRNLAGRAAESAKEIERLIKSSIERVDRGNEQMEDTQKVLHAIVDNTRKTTDVVGEISASLKEQTVAASDIRRAIDELNQVTQQNASLVEEIASSSENMSSESMELARLVSVFKVDNDSQPVMAQQRSQQVKTATKKLPAVGTPKQKKDQYQENDFDFDEKDFEKF